MGNKIERLDKNISFYRDNDVCHTCNQDIQPEIKQKYISESESQVEEFEKATKDARKLMTDNQNILDKAREIQVEIQGIQNDVFKKQTLIDSHQKVIKESENKITEIQMNSGSIDKENGKLEILRDDLKGMKGKKVNLLQTCQEHEVVVESPEGLRNQNTDCEEVSSSDESIHP